MRFVVQMVIVAASIAHDASPCSHCKLKSRPKAFYTPQPTQPPQPRPPGTRWQSTTIARQKSFSIKYIYIYINIHMSQFAGLSSRDNLVFSFNLKFGGSGGWQVNDLCIRVLPVCKVMLWSRVCQVTQTTDSPTQLDSKLHVYLCKPGPMPPR